MNWLVLSLSLQVSMRTFLLSNLLEEEETHTETGISFQKYVKQRPQLKNGHSWENGEGLSWVVQWLESAFNAEDTRFNPDQRKFPYTAERLSPRAATREPTQGRERCHMVQWRSCVPQLRLTPLNKYFLEKKMGKEMKLQLPHCFLCVDVFIHLWVVLLGLGFKPAFSLTSRPWCSHHPHYPQRHTWLSFLMATSFPQIQWRIRPKVSLCEDRCPCY